MFNLTCLILWFTLLDFFIEIFAFLAHKTVLVCKLSSQLGKLAEFSSCIQFVPVLPPRCDKNVVYQADSDENDTILTLLNI